ncbi:MAG: alkaline phosphatase family protein [Ardenticatenaceae bacterium]|nr:alkaline phosphatase family protein [Ardenticatenaceae bacterium]
MGFNNQMNRLDQLYPQEFIRPQYGDAERPGHTIANIPATIGRLFGVTLEGLPSLPDSHWRPLLAEGPVERVVLLILDAMGRNLFPPQATPLTQWLPDRPQVNETITSVVPSTTVNALSSVWTGSAPAQHGLMGIRLHFPEYGMVANMLKMSPNATRGGKGALLQAGLDPERFLARPSLGQQLRPFGIETHSFKPLEIINSGLSQMHDRGCHSVSGSMSLADMLWQIGDLLTRERHKPLLAVGYWPTVDSLSHRYGPGHPAVMMEASVLLAQINEMLVQTLSPAARQKTVILVAADHGQIDIDPAKAIDLQTHQPLREGILLDGAGEPRKPYLYVRQGKLDKLKRYVAEHFAEQMFLLSAEQALQEGWFGPPPFGEQAAGRLGDLVGFMRPNSTFIPRVDRHLLKKMVGMHGGLSPAEMFVPFWGMTL